MPKIILFSDYIKPERKVHLNNAINYIAQSENAEVLQELELRANESDTVRQREVIQNLLSLSGDLVQIDEYKLYDESRTMGNASRFISEACYRLGESALDNSRYLNYIAQRQGVEISKDHDHGLFNFSGNVDLKEYNEKMRNVQGNVFRHIVSLRIDDAIEVGFTGREAWEPVVRKEMNNVGKIMNVKPEDLDWVCAFHNSETHPHVHIMMWSKTGDPNMYLKENGLEKIKGLFGKNIYKEEYQQFYEFKNRFTQDMGLKMKSLDFFSNDYLNTSVLNNLNKLSDLIPSNYSGRWNYGFMIQPVKLVLNDIVGDLIVEQPTLKNLFDEYVSSQLAFLELYGTKTTEDEIRYNFVHPNQEDKKPFHNIVLEHFKNKFHNRESISKRKSESVNEYDYVFDFESKQKHQVINRDDEFIYLFDENSDSEFSMELNDFEKNYVVSTLNYNTVVGNGFKLVHNAPSDLREKFDNEVKDLNISTVVFGNLRNVESVTLEYLDVENVTREVEIQKEDFNYFNLTEEAKYVNLVPDFNSSIVKSMAELLKALSSTNRNAPRPQSGGNALKNELERGEKINERLNERKL